MRRYSLSKVRLLHLLEELKASSVAEGSLCVPPGYPAAKIAEMMKTVLDLKSVPDELATSLAGSSTGGIVFWGPNHWYLVMPPFPVNEERFSRTCEIEPLFSLLHKELIIGLLMIRLGEYGLGILKGESLLASKTGTGAVHARHRQGGSSSHRFERHREKQMEMFFSRICDHAREVLEPYSDNLDYILYGGTKETVTDFRKQCRFLQRYDKRTLERTINVRDPHKSGLEEGIREAWSSQVIEWSEK